MKGVDERWSDAAAIAYIQARLKGRAIRIAQKWNAITERERLILNVPIYDSDSEEEIDKLYDETDLFESYITDKLILRQAMTKLTVKEARVITELYLNGKKVSQLCSELHVSRNTIQKTKKNALKKLRKMIV